MSVSATLFTGVIAAALAQGPSESPPPSAPAGGGGPSDAAIERQSTLDIGAEPTDKFGRPGSPQRFALELKLGPYLPDIDRGYDGPGLGPYATIFGETNAEGVATKPPPNGIMPALAFDWQFFYAAGPIGVGTQVSFFRDTAAAIITNPTEEDSTIRSAADDVTFTVLPVSALLSYRFELLADRTPVPLVPYAKGGLTYGFWWTRDGRGKIARDAQGDRGLGGVWGFQLNGGLMLRLDFIERSAAKKLDQLTGINHTYVFGEFQYAQIDNFGIGNTINLGDATWFAGLAIEF